MNRSQRYASARGMTIVELMVALTIGMVLSLAVFSLMSTSEGRKRTTTSTNDINKAGAYSMYQLDRLIRSAGTGFAQSSDLTYGCKLNASYKSSKILPIAALPAPFDGLMSSIANFRLAPVLIASGMSNNLHTGESGSDVLIVMSGSSGFGEVSVEASNTPLADTLRLVNTISYRPGDLVLLADAPSSPGIATPCLIEQVSSTGTAVGANTVPLAGDYYDANGTDKAVTSFSASSIALNLGQQASFNVIGVGKNNTLFSYNLLGPAGTTASPNPSELADGVFDMRALYGLDTTGSGTINQWINPNASSYSAVYGAAALLNGSAASAASMKRIKAIRLGIIMRSPLIETAAPTGASLTLFSDLEATNSGVTYTRSLSTNERTYRYRTFESTIPLRNALLQN